MDVEKFATVINAALIHINEAWWRSHYNLHCSVHPPRASASIEDRLLIDSISWLPRNVSSDITNILFLFLIWRHLVYFSSSRLLVWTTWANFHNAVRLPEYSLVSAVSHTLSFVKKLLCPPPPQKKFWIHKTTPSPCPSPSKFNTVPMVTGCLMVMLTASECD